MSGVSKSIPWILASQSLLSFSFLTIQNDSNSQSVKLSLHSRVHRDVPYNLLTSELVKTQRIVTLIAGEEHYKYIFEVLRQIWDEDVRYQSSASKIIEHPAYQKIIALGEPMLPYIIQEVRNDDAHWFYALRKITGFTPEVGGNYSIASLQRAWINWYSEREATI